MKDVAIVRVEQLHPLPEKQIVEVVKSYSKNKEVVWVQEEPENMGYWTYMMRALFRDFPMDVIARKASASPATGYFKVHQEEQEHIINKALKIK